jgi:hypothetical protein
MNKISAHTPAFVCQHVFDNTKPILYVCKSEGDWQFLCGGYHEINELPSVVGIGHLLSRDNTLFEILDLDDNNEAERDSIGSDWKINKC